ncbi:MAG: winged helix-turn-helix domain-containing protein [Desulfobulbaceae bacterium]|nr:winged helix-turn-helix domain-containing protein [Desulfobulbaceae bacterium]
MDEGVDPTKMCQSLVDKVAQSKLLSAVSDPAILSLFESWLDELEGEVLAHMKENPAASSLDLAENLGLSKSGASFLLAKLQRGKKLGKIHSDKNLTF